MRKTDGDIYLENQRLKKEFEKLNLPLEAVMEFVPYNLEIENRRLENLLNYTKKYLECRSQKVMELLDQPFAPIFPGISPENDWLRFEKWINGEQVIQKTKDRLPENYNIIPASELSDDELEKELDKLCRLLAETGYYVGLRDDVPARLVYQMVLEGLEEEDMGGGGWHNDGCSGYCPGCIQRPWCDSGQELCWDEDEKAGKMDLVKDLEDYVSATPVSLYLIQETQKKRDEEMKKIRSEMDEDRDRSDDDFELPKLGDELFDVSDN